MTTLDRRGVLHVIKGAMSELRQESDRLAAAEKQHREEQSRQRQELEAAWRQYLETALPDTAPATLDATAARLQIPNLCAADVAHRKEERRAALGAEVARIDADDRYVRRESLLNANEIRMTELVDGIRALEPGIEALEREPRFAELIGSGYGTDRYERRWYQLSYYNDWKHGDLVLEHHGQRMGVKTFGELRTKHLEEKRALETFIQERASLEADSSAIQELARRRSEAAASLGSLDAWALGDTRARIREHLHALPDADFVGVAANAPALVLAAKRVSAIAAKVRYLDEIGTHWLEGRREELERWRAKLEKGATKLSRPGKRNSFESQEIEQKYGLPRERWADGWQEYQQASQSVVTFQRYDAYDPLRDLLWWDYMTGGSLRAGYISEVHAHHQHGADASAAVWAGSAGPELRDAS